MKIMNLINNDTVKKRLEKVTFIWNNEIFLSILLTLLIYIIAVCCSTMRWHTIDEWRMAGVLSGAFTGEPNYYHSYINVFLGMFFCVLYKAFPQFQWWYLFEHLLIIYGITALNYVALKTGVSNQISKIKINVLLFFIEIILLLRWIIEASYTTAPVIMCGGSLALILYWGGEEKNSFKKNMLVSFFSLIIAVMYRNQVGLCVLPFFLLIFFVYLLKMDIKTLKKVKYFVLLCAVFAGTQIILLQTNSYICGCVNEDNWEEMFQARVHLGDYPHDLYEENPELYKEVGITEVEAALMETGCFFEDISDPEAIMYICANGEKGTHRKNDNFITVAKEIFSSEMGIVCWTWLLLGVAAFASIKPRKIKNNFFTLCLLNNVGSLFMLLYMMSRGRMNTHALLAILYPAVVINLFCIIATGKLITEKIYNVFFLGSALLLFHSQAEYIKNDNIVNTQIICNTEKIEQYVESNMDNIYFYANSTYMKLNPFTRNYANILKTASGDMYSVSWRLQMDQNGIEHYTGDIFKRDDVFYMSSNDISNGEDQEQKIDVVIMLEYLMEEKGCTGVVKYDKIEDTDVYIYKFIFGNQKEYEDVYMIDTDGQLVRK